MKRISKILVSVMVAISFVFGITSSAFAADTLKEGTYTERTATNLTTYGYFEMSITVTGGVVTKGSFKEMNEGLGREVTDEILPMVPADQQAEFRDRLAFTKSYNDQLNKLLDGAKVAQDSKDKSEIYKAFQELWAKVIVKAGGTAPAAVPVKKVLVKIVPAKKTVTLKVGATVTNTITAYYKDGSKKNVTADVKYTSSAKALSVSKKGSFKATKKGAYTIKATYHGKVATFKVVAK